MRKTLIILIVVNLLGFLIFFFNTQRIYDLRGFHFDPSQGVAVDPADLAKARSATEMQNQIHRETIDLCSFYAVGANLLSLFNVALLIFASRKSRKVP
jgi:hypothetical protein